MNRIRIAVLPAASTPLARCGARGMGSAQLRTPIRTRSHQPAFRRQLAPTGVWAPNGWAIACLVKLPAMAGIGRSLQLKVFRYARPPAEAGPTARSFGTGGAAIWPA